MFATFRFVLFSRNLRTIFRRNEMVLLFLLRSGNFTLTSIRRVLSVLFVRSGRLI